jgi:hypothetical protein
MDQKIYQQNFIKKYNWTIVSGNSVMGAEYVNIFKNITKNKLGGYIRNNVIELYDHFLHLSTCSNSRIGKIMIDLCNEYDWESLNPKDINSLNKIVSSINMQLVKFSNIEIVDEFNGLEDDMENYVKIRIQETPLLQKIQDNINLHNPDSESESDYESTSETI